MGINISAVGTGLPSPKEDKMKKQVVIRFMAEVNQQSVNALMSCIEAKLREGIKNFKILISSSGGSVFHGISAYNFLKGIPAKVETHNFGSVDSIATVIFCAGSKRSCVPDARFLIHGVGLTLAGPTMLEAKRIREHLAGLEIDSKNIAKIIAKNCNKTQKKIEKIMFAGKTLNPKEAKQFDLVDEISNILLPEKAEIIGIG